MTYVITETCIDCTDGSCLPACPVEAIFHSDEVPAGLSHYTLIVPRAAGLPRQREAARPLAQRPPTGGWVPHDLTYSHIMALLTLDDLALEASGSTFTRVIGPDWTFADRVFGGYTAALALTAARARSTQTHLVAAHVMFLEAAQPGPISLAVTELRAGRSLWAGRVTATQAGRPALSVDVWFGDRPAVPIAAALPAPVPGPQDCPILDWLPEMWPCMGFLEERAIDYPGDPDQRGGGGRVELWARPAEEIGPDPFVAQVLDLMFADAHLMDAALRETGLRDTLGFSLDISVTWERPRAAVGWLRLSAAAESSHDGFVTCQGAVRGQDGALRLTALTQGRIFGGS